MRLWITRGFLRPAIVLAMVASLTAGGTVVTRAASSTSGLAVTDYPAAAVGTVSDSHAAASAHAVSPALRSLLARSPRTRSAAAARGARPSLTPVAPAGSENGGNGDNGQLLNHFNGVSSLDSENTNFGLEFEPPDQGLCAGNGFVLEPVNSAFRIYRTSGASIAGPFNVNDMFDRLGTDFTSDPRCYYDGKTNTWFAIILFLGTNANGFDGTSALDISVNPSGDPTTPWKTYHVDTQDLDPNKPACPCFGDQPKLGIDAYNLYVGTDEFSIAANPFYGAQIYAFSKQDLVARKHTVHFAHFKDLSIGGHLALAVEPAITNGPADAEYFLNSIDPTTTDNRIGVWAMADPSAVQRGRAPTLSSTVIRSEPFGVPPPAVQKGSSSLLDSGDDRMQQVQYINGTLWGALDTAVTIPNDPVARAGAAWFNVRPTLGGKRIGEADLVRQGYVALKGNYLLYPAVQADFSGNAAMVLTVSGKNRFPSAAFTTLQNGQEAFGPITVAAAGTGPYDPNSTRWGDYSWAQLDPATDTFWLATEYIPPKSSQTTDGLSNWGTDVLQVRVGSSNQTE